MVSAWSRKVALLNAADPLLPRAAWCERQAPWRFVMVPSAQDAPNKVSAIWGLVPLSPKATSGAPECPGFTATRPTGSDEVAEVPLHFR